MTMWTAHTHDRSRQVKTQHAGDDDPRPTPSQAEGDRETVERSLGEEHGNRAQTRDDGQGDMVHTPSQAEGDRETVERNLEEKQGQ
jgi:hypothetical protein